MGRNVMRGLTSEQRLNSRLVHNNGCLEFNGSKNNKGYGKLWVDGKLMLAHRLAYLLANGRLEKVICHKCDNPICCNPDHLFGGTHKDNTADMYAKSRHSHGARHAEAIKSGWTPELRAMRSAQTRKRLAEKRAKMALEANAPDGTKRCCKCKEWVSVEYFGRNRTVHDGLEIACKPCLAKIRKLRSNSAKLEVN